MKGDPTAANKEFWDELCGAGLARQEGIVDHSEDSLRRFDAAYLGLYPYLLEHVRPDDMAGRDVLEVGLGYGTLGNAIVAAGARYVGLDVARRPVALMRHRLELGRHEGQVVQASMLDCPLRDGCMDRVVSIGCFHHTGDLQRCIDGTFRILRQGGVAILMVYNQFSYRQWRRWPQRTLRALAVELGLLGGAPSASEEQRRAYDAASSGGAAPETTFTSRRGVRRMLSRFSSVEITKENCDEVGFAGWSVSRRRLLSSLGRTLGLDLYVRAVK